MKYISMADTFIRNGDRHLSNAIGYAARGLPAYSEGSERKARRNYSRANNFRLDPLTAFFAEILQRGISRSIMERGA